ncbi:hypothetical protein DB347_17685 [Opitutaceae bacterium EW11]|nr:hypothetical protein DB347_17685 [Opitutaceae bacterium EW11]
MSDSKTYPITGNTYPIRDQLKACGCRWDATKKYWYATSEECAKKAQAFVPTAALNSPAPRDMGPIDAKVEAAKFGRVATSEKTSQHMLRSFRGQSRVGNMFRDEDGLQLVLRAGRPYYLTRDMIEDFDWFSMEPGWYVDCDCVSCGTDSKRGSGEESC